MSNPFYTRLFNAAPLTFARSSAVSGEFARVELAMDAVNTRFLAIDPYNTELVAARQGQASLLVNLQRYVSTIAPATGNVDMGGYRVTNAGPPLSAGDLVNKGYADALVISATAPWWSPSDTAINKVLSPFESCTVTGGSPQLTLPASPTYGVTRVRVRVRPGLSATVVRNGLPIMGLAEDMSMTGGQWCELQAENATDGWVLA